MKLPKFFSGLALLSTLLIAFGWTDSSAHASGIVFPSDAGVINVTQPPYNAVPNDSGDDTAAIQAALNAAGQNNRIVYLPEGLYRVSAQLNWAGTNGGTTIGKRTILQGAGRDLTIIEFHNPSVTSGSVIVTGGGAAQNFRNGIRDLTVRIAAGNSANLHGVTFVSNNQGTIANVRIQSVSGAGYAGLNLAAGENGPLLARNIEVLGFDYGVSAGNTVVSQTIENLRLVGQNLNGIRVHNQALFVRGLHSTNAVTVAHTVRDTNAFLVLSDALLEGTGNASTLPAIFSDKTGYYRNIKSSGYQRTIRHDDKNRGNTAGVAGTYAEEFLSHGSAQSAFAQHGTKTLGLEIQDAPEIAWHPLSEWRGPHQHGGVAGDGGDDTAAIQAAINTGAATLYLPNGSWTVNGTITVPASVRRIIGCEASIGGTGKFLVATSGEPLVMERIQFGLSSGVRLEHTGNRTVVLSAISEMQYIPGTAPGDLFIEDVNFNRPPTFRNQRVWARQLNQETDTQSSGSYDAKVTADHAKVWISGIKTERAGTIVKAINGSKVEVTGAYVLANTSVTKTDPIYEVIDSQASFAGTTVRVFGTPNYATFLRETRSGVTQTLPNSGSILLAAAYPPPPANTNPVANPDSVSVGAGSAVLIQPLANDTDPNNDTLVITGYSTPSHGRLFVSGGSILYQSEPGYTGLVELIYQIHDHKGGRSWSTVSLQITAQAPPTLAIAYSTDGRGGSTSVNLTAKGNLDWVQMGQTGGEIRKASGGVPVGRIQVLASAGSSTDGEEKWFEATQWTDGTPTVSGSTFRQGRLSSTTGVTWEMSVDHIEMIESGVFSFFTYARGYLINVTCRVEDMDTGEVLSSMSRSGDAGGSINQYYDIAFQTTQTRPQRLVVTASNPVYTGGSYNRFGINAMTLSGEIVVPQEPPTLAIAYSTDGRGGSTSVNLTAEGNLDWVQMGQTGGEIRKASGGVPVGRIQVLASAGSSTDGEEKWFEATQWTDGTPSVSGSTFRQGRLSSTTGVTWVMSVDHIETMGSGVFSFFTYVRGYLIDVTCRIEDMDTGEVLSSLSRTGDAGGSINQYYDIAFQTTQTRPQRLVVTVSNPVYTGGSYNRFGINAMTLGSAD
jgi:hypothetical protein